MVAFGLALTLRLSVGVALAAPGASFIKLAPWLSADYESGAVTFGRVSHSLVDEVTGDDGIGRIFDPGEYVIAFPDPDPGDLADPAQPPPPPPAPPPPPPEAPALTVMIVADREEAQQGDLIYYTVTTTNVGRAAADGVRVQSHIPAGTGLAGVACDGEPVLVDPDRQPPTCVDANNVTTTPSAPGAHMDRILTVPLAAGESDVWRFAVRVHSTTPDGTVLSNHAHAYADNHPRVHSGAVAVTVV